MSKGLNIRITGDIKDFTTKMDMATKKMKKVGKQMQATGKQMSRNFSAPLAIIAGLSVKVFADFEQSMAKVKAVSGATGDEFAKLEQLAKDLGASTRYTATEVADLQLNYSKLGFIPAEIEKITGATLDLALATGEDLAQSATVAGATLRGFGLDASEMPRVVDVMAKSFSSSGLDLEKFSIALPKVAGAAKVMGVSLEETTAMLGTLVDRGTEASTAGTALKRMFIEMNAKGLTLKEGLTQIANSQDKLGTATKLVGKIAAVSAIQLAENMTATEGLKTTLDGAEGSAKNMAAIMDDTLQGAMFRMKSALEGAAISIGEMLAPMISKLSAFVGKLANGFKELSPTAKKIILIIGGIVAAIGPLLVVLGVLMTSVIPGLIVAFKGMRKGISGIGTAFKKLSLSISSNPIGALLTVIGLAVAAFLAYKRSVQKAKDEQNELNESLENTDKLMKQKAYDEFLKSSGLFIAKITDIGNGVKVATQEMANIEEVAAKFKETVKTLDKSTLENFKTAVVDQIISLKRNLKSSGITDLQKTIDTAKVKDLSKMLVILNTELKGIAKTTEDVNGETNNYSTETDKATESNDAYLLSIQKLKEEQKSRRQTIDIQTPSAKIDTGGMKASIPIMPAMDDKAIDRFSELTLLMDNLKKKGEETTPAFQKLNAEFEILMAKQSRLEEMATAVSSAVGQVAESFGNKLVESLGLAESGFQGFIGGMAKTVIALLAQMMAASIGAAIEAGSLSALGTGVAAAFTAPAFIATAVGGVLAAFAAIPAFASGVENFGGGLALVGERGPELVNLPRGSDVIPNNQIGNAGGQVFIPNMTIKGSDLLIVFDRAQRKKSKVA